MTRTGTGAAEGERERDKPGRKMPCAGCGATNSPKRCAGCKAVSYCNTVCQTAHWKAGHKKECGRLRDELQRALGATCEQAATQPAPSSQRRGFLLGGLGNVDGKDKADAQPAITVASRTERLIQSCSDGVLRAEASVGLGRSIVASKLVLSGAILMQADCYSTVLSEAMATQACSRCMTLLPGGGVRCKGCATCFCTASCLDESGPEHAAECPALAMLKSVDERLRSDQESVRLLFRVLARRAVEAPVEDGEIDFRDVETLLAHKDQVDRLTPAMGKAIEEDGRLLFSMLPPPVAKGLTSKDLMLLLLRIKFNSHPIYDSTGSSRIGLGLYPAAALINHACSFNAVCSFAPGGAVLNVRAVRPIDPGEQVCYSYIDPYQARRSRRIQVQYSLCCLRIHSHHVPQLPCDGRLEMHRANMLGSAADMRSTRLSFGTHTSSNAAAISARRKATLTGEGKGRKRAFSQRMQ